MKSGNKSRRPVLSLQLLLVSIVLLCWVVPFSVILIYSGVAVSQNVQGRIEDTIENSARLAFDQAYENLQRAMDASRAPNYDGSIRTSWLQYLSTEDEIRLYDSVSSYLSQKYAYDDNFHTTYAFFAAEADKVYYANHHTNAASASSLSYYLDNVHDEVLRSYQKIDTDIRFFSVGSRVYMMRSIIDMRNIVSSSPEPYAVIVMECNPQVLFENIRSIIWLTDATVRVNDTEISLIGDEQTALFDYPAIMAKDEDSGKYLQGLSKSEYSFKLELDIASDATDLISQFPDNRNIMLLFAALALPLLLFSLFAFYRHVTIPADRLVAATTEIEKGRRGYQVEEMPRNREFYCLTQQFNSMSVQLDHQFKRIYEEQQALQEARIKALRSQINPHFLNNTLEIINWEARLAKNEKVSEMIDALAIMLGAATARSDSAVVDLRSELNYVDAYLHIIKQRFGNRLNVSQQIDQSLLSCNVPSLILQPIVENAIEHGIAQLQQGELIIRAYKLQSDLVLEVENDGVMTDQDRQTIDELLSGESSNSSVGIRNVNQRLRIMYGADSGLAIEQLRPGRILAKIRIPL